jgi:hypothetical protein
MKYVVVSSIFSQRKNILNFEQKSTPRLAIGGFLLLQLELKK